MQDHHRQLIEREAEAWMADAPVGIDRKAELCDFFDGLLVKLDEHSTKVMASRVTTVPFPPDEMPLSPRMVKERFANPFGAK